MRRQLGFTGIEIAVGMAILLIIASGVYLSLRQRGGGDLEIAHPPVTDQIHESADGSGSASHPSEEPGLTIEPVEHSEPDPPTEIHNPTATSAPVVPTNTPLPVATVPAPSNTPIPTLVPTPSASSRQATPTFTPSPTEGPTPEPSCISNTSPTFTNHITDIGQVNYIVPPPTMGSGPSLKTHSYIGTDGANVPVYAPAALTLNAGSHYVGGPYTIEFLASCEVTVRFGHITAPVDRIKNLLPSEPGNSSATQYLTPLKFAAGELVGYTTGTSQAGNWDFGVYNSATSNRYAGDPDWGWSTTYTTAVCPFDYFTSGLKSEYVAKFDPDILGGNPPHGESFCEF